MTSKKYVQQIIKNTKTLAEELKRYNFDLISGGTENHLVLVDLTNKGVSGKEAQNLLEEAGIIINRNSIPYDQRKPFDPSGIRIGTPALTTRGLREKEMRKIVFWINEVISNKRASSRIKKEVKKL